MFAAGVEEEVRAALRAEPSATASRIIGLHEVATLPREAAIEALILRTRRYAAYQRKWLRRLEGLAMVAADRPPEEIAAEIVTLARTWERLSRP
jgi:tRNA A37 N6-isopentenylltransferase MiaA